MRLLRVCRPRDWSSLIDARAAPMAARKQAGMEARAVSQSRVWRVRCR